MKKVVCFIFLVVVFIASVSCKNDVNYDMYISENRTNVYEGSLNDVCLTVYAEQRETPYVTDGFVGEIKNVLTVKLSGYDEKVDSASVKIVIDGETYQKDFEYSIIKNKFMAEIEVKSLPSTPTLSAVLTTGGEECEISLTTKVFSETIDYKTALKSVISHDGATLKPLFETGNVCTEIHVRIIVEDSANYYYVGFVTKEGKTRAYLVDGASGKVLAERK